MLVDFYDSLAATIKALRDEHLNELRSEQMKCMAAGELQFSHLEMHMEDLNAAWEDIEETFHDVIDKIDPQSFEDGMRAYRNTLNVFRHKLEEFDDGTLPLTNLDSTILSTKLKSAEATLLGLWRE